MGNPANALGQENFDKETLFTRSAIALGGCGGRRGKRFGDTSRPEQGSEFVQVLLVGVGL